MEDKLSHTYLTLDDGRDVHVFLNHTTCLLVVNVLDGKNFGTEVVRMQLSSPRKRLPRGTVKIEKDEYGRGWAVLVSGVVDGFYITKKQAQDRSWFLRRNL